ncbi:acyl-CoA N-acyltransferase [Microthyrium microscopicum]|uniref:Acyl-CoA N-acyltransferase n=1 Tax=Microthyrium microscopicum TaxID=703497 RepID=A0A6A6U4W0_9PEZI|nr:acyl-CoA N-acyltransferase [Microthyrium microscopicum]
MQSSITSWLNKKPPRPKVASGITAPDKLKLQSPFDSSQSPRVVDELSSQKHVNVTKKACGIPTKAQVQAVTEATLPELRKLVQILLPIPYPDKFFREILNDEVTASLTLVVLWSDDEPISNPRVVAGIRGRLLAKTPNGNTTVKQLDLEKPCLYIATIGTLAPYRGHGLATTLLRQITARAIEDYGIATVTAHVWETNEEARGWYSNLGFTEVLYEPHYYRRLKPSGAYLLERRVRPTDLLNDPRKENA